MTPSLTVIIVTWRRPEFVRSCLQHLMMLDGSSIEIIVVDASPDGQTASIVRDFHRTRYVSFAGGAGRMTKSRNAGLLLASGDIIAFVDDDANARTGWAHGIRQAFSDLSVAAVAGRTCRGLPGEDVEGFDSIGNLLPNGELTANFAADPGSIIEVDHGMGANMAFRADVLAELGGFRDDFLGVGAVREDTDIFLRVKALGLRSVFAPNAIVDHSGAPHVRGRRFDFRYAFWANHNHVLLLARNLGLGSRELRAWLATRPKQALRAEHSSFVRRVAWLVIEAAGVLAGIGTGLFKAKWTASDPIRGDRTGEMIREHLRTSGQS
jgi:GT2 family glycosyltransferase